MRHLSHSLSPSITVFLSVTKGQNRCLKTERLSFRESTLGSFSCPVTLTSLNRSTWRLVTVLLTRMASVFLAGFACFCKWLTAFLSLSMQSGTWKVSVLKEYGKVEAANLKHCGCAELFLRYPKRGVHKSSMCCTCWEEKHRSSASLWLVCKSHVRMLIFWTKGL